jgi:hypothetical protein
LARLRRAKQNLEFYWDFILWQAPNAAKRSLRERFAANLILALIFLKR